MSLGRILVVAASIDIRQSLTFALEMEGFAVTSRPDVPGIDGAADYDCVILDHRAAAPDLELSRTFCAKAPYVIALSSRPLPWLADLADEVVATPVDGRVLVEAAHRAATRDPHLFM